MDEQALCQFKTIDGQSTILQRCKQTIESLHQQLELLQIKNQQASALIDGLKKDLLEKDFMIKQLKQRVNNPRIDGNGFIESENEFKKQKYKNISCKQIQDVNHLRIEFELNHMDQENNNNLSNNDSHNIMSKYGNHQIGINLSDLFATDKRILICLLQHKQKQITSLIEENRKLKQQIDQISKYCKSEIKRISSQYQIEPKLINNRSHRFRTQASQNNMKVSNSINSQKSTTRSQSKKNLNGKKLLVNNSNKTKSKNNQHLKSAKQIYFVK